MNLEDVGNLIPPEEPFRLPEPFSVWLVYECSCGKSFDIKFDAYIHAVNKCSGSLDVYELTDKEYIAWKRSRSLAMFDRSTHLACEVRDIRFTSWA